MTSPVSPITQGNLASPVSAAAQATRPETGPSAQPAASRASVSAARAPQISPRRMNLWRLEWLRLIRTPRALALGAVFLATGLIEPAVTRYASTIFAHVGKGVHISAPLPTAADGLGSYVTEITLVGLILVVILTASAFSFDSQRGLATFLRTRVSSSWQLVAPRFVAYAVAAAAAYLIGTLAAWYETSALIGSLHVAAVFGGVLCGAVYLVFGVAVTALASSVARSTVAIAGCAVIMLLALPVLGLLQPVSRWLPTALAGAPYDLAAGTHRLPYFLPTLAIALAATAAALVLAARRLRTREL
jgi:ABC-2 type transport system permease protein